MAQPRYSEARTSSPVPGDKGAPPLGLRYTDTPGVYLNSRNMPVDEDGILLGFKDVQRRDAAHWSAALTPEGADAPGLTPAQFLTAVANNATLPLSVRIDAAKAAAPYTDRKQPAALDGGLGPDGAPLGLFTNAENLSTEELRALKALLLKAGAT